MNQKKQIYLIFFLCIISVFTACSKQSDGKKALQEMEKIVETAEKNKDKLTSEEWDELVVRFEENKKIATEATDTGKLSDKNKIKLTELIARWATLNGESNIEGITPQISNLLQNFTDDLGKMVDSMSEESIMQQALKDTVK